MLKPFIILEKSKKEVDAICSRLESQEKTDIVSQLHYLYAQNPSLRRGWDSNPRRACALNCFQDNRTRPLCDLSEYFEERSPRVGRTLKWGYYNRDFQVNKYLIK